MRHTHTYTYTHTAYTLTHDIKYGACPCGKVERITNRIPSGTNLNAGVFRTVTNKQTPSVATGKR